MNEEWYNDRLRKMKNPQYVCLWITLIFIGFMLMFLQAGNYDIWLTKLVQAYEPSIDAKDRTFSRFLLDIPHVPRVILTLLRDLCLEGDR